MRSDSATDAKLQSNHHEITPKKIAGKFASEITCLIAGSLKKLDIKCLNDKLSTQVGADNGGYLQYNLMSRKISVKYPVH